MTARDDTRNPRLHELYKLISAPLLAALDADFMAAKRLTKLILHYGFEPGDNPDDPFSVSKPRMVYFDYRQSTATSSGKKMQIGVPLLSLLVLPLLQIRDAQFEFDLDVSSDVNADAQSCSVADESADLTGDLPQKYPEFLARFASSPPSRRNAGQDMTVAADKKDDPYIDGNMKVKISAAQADMPQGLAVMLNLMGGDVPTQPVK